MKTETFYDLTELKKAKFQPLCDKCTAGIIELKKGKSYDIVLSLANNWGGGGGGGGSFPPASPVDNSLDHDHRSSWYSFSILL